MPGWLTAAVLAVLVGIAGYQWHETEQQLARLESEHATLRDHADGLEQWRAEHLDAHRPLLSHFGDVVGLSCGPEHLVEVPCPRLCDGKAHAYTRDLADAR